MTQCRRKHYKLKGSFVAENLAPDLAASELGTILRIAPSLNSIRTLARDLTALVDRQRERCIALAATRISSGEDDWISSGQCGSFDLYLEADAIALG